MANVYINDVLQTSPIKMTVKSNTNMDFTLPSTGGGYNDLGNIIPFVHNNNLYIHLYSSLFRWNGTGWHKLGSVVLPRTLAQNNVYFTGVLNNKIISIGRPGNNQVRLCEVDEVNENAAATVTILSTSALTGMSNRPGPHWSVVYNNKVHMFAYNGIHWTYDATNGLVQQTTINSNISSYFCQFLVYNNKLIAFCLDDNRAINEQGFIMEYNDANDSWTEVISNSFGANMNVYDKSNYINQRVCVDSHNYIHRGGGLTGSSDWQDSIFSIESDYSAIHDENWNKYPGHLGTAIIAFDGYIWILGGRNYGSGTTGYTLGARIPETDRLQYSDSWKTSDTKTTYQIVSSTVNLPNNDTITFDASGNVVSN